MARGLSAVLAVLLLQPTITQHMQSTETDENFSKASGDIEIRYCMS